VINLVDGDQCTWEQPPLQTLAETGQLSADGILCIPRQSRPQLLAGYDGAAHGPYRLRWERPGWPSGCWGEGHRSRAWPWSRTRAPTWSNSWTWPSGSTTVPLTSNWACATRWMPNLMIERTGNRFLIGNGLFSSSLIMKAARSLRESMPSAAEPTLPFQHLSQRSSNT
jgi:hypothetical protein